MRSLPYGKRRVTQVDGLRCSVGCSYRLPLYLYGRVTTRVAADSKSLVVRRASHAVMRYPSARISRVVAGSRVQWDAAALALCGSSSIAIVFLGAYGRPSAYFRPVQLQHSPLDQVLYEFVRQERWPEHYANWLRAERMRVLESWRADTLTAGHNVQESMFQMFLRKHVYRNEDPMLGVAGEALFQSALSAYALEQSQNAGVATHYIGDGGRPLNLVSDITELLTLVLFLQIHGIGDALDGEEAALLWALHTFGSTLSSYCTAMFGRLHRRLREQAEEWR